MSIDNLKNHVTVSNIFTSARGLCFHRH